MKKLHIGTTTFLLAAAVLLGGCTEQQANNTAIAGAGEGFGVKLSDTAWYKNPYYKPTFSSARYYY